jgi:glycosyltransferase involved in cell wall biosynthesis
VLRWATWWPTQYWVDRFDELGRRLGSRFEAVFLAADDAHYDGLELEPELWQFCYRMLSKRRSAVGFYRHAKVPRNPFPIIAGGRTTILVMTYADPTFFAAAMLARMRGLPYHLFVANTAHDARTGSRRNEFLKRWIFSGASTLLVTGPHQKEYARSYGPAVPIAEIGNPVDNRRLTIQADHLLKKRDALRAKYGWDSDDFIVVFVGRLAPEKDLATPVRAAGRLRESSRRISLVLVGTGPAMESLRSLGQTLDVEVRFPGFLQGRALHEAYAVADVFVLPSMSESWGLVVNEGMIFSLPILVSNRVGSRHLLESGGGFVFPAGDDAALAEVLRALTVNESLRQSVGAAARKTIEPHTVERWADTVLDTLQVPG